MSFAIKIRKTSGELTLNFEVPIEISTDFVQWVENKCRTTFGVTNGTICKQLSNGTKVTATNFIDGGEYTFEYFEPAGTVSLSNMLFL